MKNLILPILLSLCPLFLFAQVTFEKGYFIKNNGERTECLIQDRDWRLNPDEFKYKLTENGEKATETIETVKEFGVYDLSKYIRFEGLIDTSKTSVEALSENKAPEFKNVTIFLKMIVEGDASLYLFKDKSHIQYFYTVNDKKIEQLIHKEYINYTTGNKRITTNSQYKKQLLRNLECEKITIPKVNSVEYSIKPLKKLFIEYNDCKGSKSEVFTAKKADFNLGIKASYGLRNFYVDQQNVIVDFSNMGFRYGFELETVLPFNKNKWAVVFEPTYQKNNDEAIFEPKFGITDYNVVLDYSSIELPIGVRYYMYLNDDSKLFISASIVQDIPIKSAFYLNTRNFPISSGLSFQGGIGYKYKNLASLEIRGYSPRSVTVDYVSIQSKYQGVMLTLGVYIF